jgi:DNA-binding protein HU-beta
MNKQELVAAVAQLSGYSQEVVREVLNSTNLVARATVRTGEDVFLFGVGKLEVRKRGPRKARNLHTCEEVMVPARNAVLFKPSVSLVQAANANA